MSFESNEINIALQACSIIKNKPEFSTAVSVTYQAPRSDKRTLDNQYYIQFDNVNRISDDCMWIKKRFTIRITYGCNLKTQDAWNIGNKIKDCLITTCNNKIPD